MSPYRFVGGLLAAVVLSPLAQAQAQREWLGEAPIASASLQEIPGPWSAPYNAQAVAFDPLNRSQVATAYRNVYVPQAAVPISWTGSISGCAAGSTNVAHRQAVIDRVNFYRALAGVPGTVSLYGGAQATQTQAAALIFSASQTLSHTPSSGLACYSLDGYNGAGKSNIALGYGSNAAAGTSAVDLYMDDQGAGNYMVGHRRWILYPPQVKMDSGSIPWSPQWASNALYVLGSVGSRPPTPNGVAWPNRGYVPWQLLPIKSNRWSFSWPGANFANATVSMTRNGQALAAPTREVVANGYGDNTLVWLPQGVSYTRPTQDVVYQVTISGISGGGAPASVSYTVTVIDPDTALPNSIFRHGFEG